MWQASRLEVIDDEPRRLHFEGEADGFSFTKVDFAVKNGRRDFLLERPDFDPGLEIDADGLLRDGGRDDNHPEESREDAHQRDLMQGDQRRGVCDDGRHSVLATATSVSNSSGLK